MWQRAGLAVLVLVFLCTNTEAADRTFVVLGKSADDINFVDVLAGCQEQARLHGDRCVQGGAKGTAHFRGQNAALRSVIESGPDGIALSVTKGPFLAQNALSDPRADEPVLITFDSDFGPAFRDLRQAYVGPDNEQVGKELAQMLLETDSRPGKVCFLSSDPKDTNLKERIEGARRHLETRSAWSEAERCPLYNGDSVNGALKQLDFVLTKDVASAVISVGAWPVLAPERFSTVVTRARAKGSERVPILVATGSLRDVDFRLLANHKVDGFVSIDFREMGRRVYDTLSQLSDGDRVPDFIETPVVKVMSPIDATRDDESEHGSQH
ncbi:substrate-binding domain-containing protein [Halovibrio salipaludis]|nr:substrate-binding domain-containing protein [Halovibrio salipaludis]